MTIAVAASTRVWLVHYAMLASTKAILFIALVSSSAYARSEPEFILVTSVQGSWRVENGAKLKQTDVLEPGQKVLCTDPSDPSAELGISANGVPAKYACSGKPVKIEVPAKPGITDQWLRSLNSLVAKKRPTFATSIGRGVDPEVAVMLPLGGGVVDFSPSLASYARSLPVSIQDILITLEPLDAESLKPRETRSAKVQLARTRLLATAKLEPGLFYLSVTAPANSRVLVYLPPSGRAKEFSRRFAEIRTLTETWPREDAKAFQMYCLNALAEEAR